MDEHQHIPLINLFTHHLNALPDRNQTLKLAIKRQIKEIKKRATMTFRERFKPGVLQHKGANAHYLLSPEWMKSLRAGGLHQEC